MPYRVQADIFSQILEAANGGATKTKIMYKAYLSYAQLKEYLSVLVGKGLLESDCTGQSYTTTNKGQKFLKLYSQLGTYMEGVGLEIPRT
jgi:predicted transcriptional regulator